MVMMMMMMMRYASGWRKQYHLRVLSRFSLWMLNYLFWWAEQRGVVWQGICSTWWQSSKRDLQIHEVYEPAVVKDKYQIQKAIPQDRSCRLQCQMRASVKWIGIPSWLCWVYSILIDFADRQNVFSRQLGHSDAQTYPPFFGLSLSLNLECTYLWETAFLLQTSLWQ